MIPRGLDSDPAYKNVLTKTVLYGEHIKFETFLKPINKWLSVSLYSAEKGFFVSLVDDITERKTVEEKIAKLNSELELRIKERTAELVRANKDLEEINDLFVGNEIRIMELKKELAEMKMNK